MGVRARCGRSSEKGEDSRAIEEKGYVCLVFFGIEVDAVDFVDG